MGKKTTVKPIGLGYRNVGSNSDYTKLMGVLKGLALAQDDPNSTEIEAEFYDAPFDIIYEGQPVKMTFELANYDLSELPALFGGTYDAVNNVYSGATNAFTSEHEWKLDFGRGNSAIIIARGLTIGTLKKEAEGALNYNVTITAMVYTDTSKNPSEDILYKIVGSQASQFTAVDPEGAGYSTKNPKTEGWYETDGTGYRLTWDTKVVDGKTYYTKD